MSPYHQSQAKMYRVQRTAAVKHPSGDVGRRGNPRKSTLLPSCSCQLSSFLALKVNQYFAMLHLRQTKTRFCAFKFLLMMSLFGGGIAFSRRGMYVERAGSAHIGRQHMEFVFAGELARIDCLAFSDLLPLLGIAAPVAASLRQSSSRH